MNIIISPNEYTLRVSKTYQNSEADKRGMALSLALSFIMVGYDKMAESPSLDTPRSWNSDAAAELVVGHWNITHGLELYMKTILSTLGGSHNSNDHKIRPVYNKLKVLEPLIEENLTGLINLSPVTGTRMATTTLLNKMDKQYTRLRYFGKENGGVTLPDSVSIVTLTMALLGTFTPRLYKRFIENTKLHEVATT